MSISLNLLNRIKPKIKTLPDLALHREQLALGAILLLSTFLGFWNLSINGYSNVYYASAVRSMLQSWHNFFYVSFDPGGFVSVDKPPVAFWIQAAFSQIFGFSGVSLLLPEALAGVGGVFLLYCVVKRAFGAGAGLLAALLLAITPIWVVMNRDNNPDSILVFTLLLAAWAILRAAEKGRLEWLLLSGFMIGIAFNVKMLEAYVVLPAFYGMYFLFARTDWRKRILHLALVSVVIAVISFSWAATVDLTPASDRPYVGSSSGNSELDLILNYNGLGRVDGNEKAGTAVGNGTSGTFGNGSNRQSSVLTGGPSTPSSQNSFNPNQNPPGGGGPGFGGPAGITRLLVPQMAGEFNWFMPLAMVGLIYSSFFVLIKMAKGTERSRQLQTLALFGGWFLIYGLVFSFSKGIFHNYYLIIMAPAGAALAGVGLVRILKQYCSGGWQAFLLPVSLAATALYQAYILSGFISWNLWLSPILLIVGLVAPIGLVFDRVYRKRKSGQILSGALVWVVTAFLLVTPAAWSFAVLFKSISGSIVSAVPGGGSDAGGFRNTQTSSGFTQTWLDFIYINLSGEILLALAVLVAAAVLYGLSYFLRRRLFNSSALSGLLLAFFLLSSSGWWINQAQAQTTPALSQTNPTGEFRGGMPSERADPNLVKYLENNQGGYKYIVAVSSSMAASPIILSSGLPVMALGGFNGSDKIITTTSQLEKLISSRTVRYFLGGGKGGPGGTDNLVSQYLQEYCKVVESSYNSSINPTASPSSNNGNQVGSNTGDSPDFNSRLGSPQQLYICGS